MNQRGFTLVEMLVGLAIFAVIAAAGVGVMAWSADQQAAVRARMDRLGQVQRAHALLKADLSQVALRQVRSDDAGMQRNAFNAAPPGNGERSLFAFVRRGWSNPDAVSRASMQYVEYRITDGRLERSARTMLDGAALSAPQVLLDDVVSVRAHFYSYRQWSDGWIGGPTALPRAVMLDMELRDLGSMRQVYVLPDEGL